MEKIFFLFFIFSQVFAYKYETINDYSIQLIDVDFNEGHWTNTYSNDYYDYFVIRGEIKEYHTIYFNISSRNQINPYYYFTNDKLSEREVSTIIDNFYQPHVSVTQKGDYYYYYTFFAQYSGSYKNYCYLAIHSQDKGYINFDLYSSYKSYSAGSWLRSPWKRFTYLFLIYLIASYSNKN